MNQNKAHPTIISKTLKKRREKQRRAHKEREERQ